MNSHEYFAGGIALDFQYNLPLSMTLGLSVTASNNFNGLASLEPGALFRWYFLNKNHSGLFAQADAGAFLIFEKGDFIPMAMGGLGVGFRIPIGKSFYIEPYGRGGYPFLFGIGVMAGVRFKEETELEEEEEPWEENDFGVFRR